MIVVIGGGPAGRIASMRLAVAGKEVTLFELGKIGGQCLHAGCMPVCALNDVARFLNTARRFQDLGIIGSVPVIDFPAALKEMGAVQKKITSILDHETKEAGVEIVYGKEARLEGRNVLVNGENIAAEAVIAATGSRPNIPECGGLDNEGVYNPHSIWSIKRLPKRIVIVGGGVMAAEFAYLFHAFGSDVSVICRSGFLKGLDPHLRKIALKELSGVTILENTEICSVDGNKKVRGVTVTSGRSQSAIEADSVLLTTGLVPRSEMLNGLRKGPAGEIIVDDHMSTSVKGVYACGDVTGPPCLTPVARHQGVVAADNILGKKRKMDYRFIPQSINLTNELAFCGEAGPKDLKIAIPGPAGPGTFWSVLSGDTGLAKISADADTGAISGIACAGPGGGLITGYMAFLMQKNFSVNEFDNFIEVHPSTDGVYGLAKYASEILRKRNST